MPSHRKRPESVDAVRWFPGADLPGVVELKYTGPTGELVSKRYAITETVAGFMKVEPGDWVVTGPRGRRVLRAAQFDDEYEPHVLPSVVP